MFAMLKINPAFMECISDIKNKNKDEILQSMKIEYNKDYAFLQKDSVFYFEPDCKKFTHVVAFDLDWTLSYNEKHLYPKEADDIQIFPNRREILENIIKLGYTIVIFTNQYAKSKKEKQIKVERVVTFLKKLNLPIFVYISTEKDNYRKPEIGMWNMFSKDIKIEKLLFIGDAMGRTSDFSDSDRIFGENIKAELHNPEEFFGESPIPVFKKQKELVVFVGMPGSWKSSYYYTHLADHVHIEQDKLKTRKKVLNILDNTLLTGKSIVIDSTNPKQENRLEYYNKAIEHGYSIKVLYFLRNGTGFNKLRENPVPDIVYHIYFKNLNPPTVENTPGEVYYVY